MSVPADDTAKWREERWQVMLTHEEPVLRTLAERASREPVLRALFPFRSHDDLRFTSRTTYPYDPLPFLGMRKGAYIAYTSGFDPISTGTLDEVVLVLVGEMEKKLRELGIDGA